VIDATTITLPTTLTSSDIRCFAKGCHGIVKTSFNHKNEEIHWYCPDCDNEGMISNWQGTRWDNRR
jgi:hypothetical protein